MTAALRLSLDAKGRSATRSLSAGPPGVSFSGALAATSPAMRGEPGDLVVRGRVDIQPIATITSRSCPLRTSPRDTGQTVITM